MKPIHVDICAKRHITVQVPIATLRNVPFGSLCTGMSGSFRNALKWHMEKHETRVTDLAHGTGISRDIINKLLSRENASTAVENAVMIAAYYGKSVESFIRCDSSDQERPLSALAELLTPDEERMLEAQVRGILAQRAPR